MIDYSGIRVLIVDDERFIRESLVEFFRDYRFKVSWADSAESALSGLKRNMHDIAVIDLRLPGMSGDSLIQEIHKIDPAFRFLIHTGSVGYCLSEDLRAIGMKPEHVFYKPQLDLTIMVKMIVSLVNHT
ncbi:response regulator [bacterium]|nr:response regulator [bacterium]